MGWHGHKGTFVCPDHPKLTVRARRWRGGNATTSPCCRSCGKPMQTVETMVRIREYGRIRLRAFRQDLSNRLR